MPRQTPRSACTAIGLAIIIVAAAGQTRGESPRGNDSAGPVVPASRDTTIRTRRSSTRGRTAQTTTLILKGPWQRWEYTLERARSGSMVSWTTGGVTIVRCDDRQIFNLNTAARTFVVLPLPDIAGRWRRQAAGSSRTTEPSAQGPDVTITVEAVDIGERRPVLQFAARHVITTTKIDAPPEATTRPGTTVVDGWYIDVPSEDCRESNGDGLAFGTVTRAGQPQDRIHYARKGNGRRGFAVEETARTVGDSVVTESVELMEASNRQIADSLFRVPDDYRPALRRLWGGFDMDKPDTLANRAEMYWEALAAWVNGLFR